MSVFSPEVLITNTPLPVDGSGVTQPVSGTVAVNNFPATQPVSGTVAVSNFPGTQAVTGPLTNTELRATPVPVSVDPEPTTATVSRVSVGAGAAVTLITSDANRKRVIIFNETGTLHIKFGTNASVTDYTYRLSAGASLIESFPGQITAIKASGTSAVQITSI